MTKRLMALCVVVAMAVAACSSGADPRPASLSRPEPGQCLANEATDLDQPAPDYASVVGCKAPHVYEIFDVLNVPAKFVVSGSPERRLERRKELNRSTAADTLAQDFHSYADRTCRGSMLLATGLDGVDVAGKGALDAGVRPVLVGARMQASVGPPDRWAAGKPAIVCSFRYTVPAGPAAPLARVAAIQSTSKLPTYRALLTPDFPAELRACGSYDADNYLYAVLCTFQHNAETLFSYDAEAAFGKTFAEAVDSTNPTNAQWDKLDAACSDALDKVFDPGIHKNVSSSVYLGNDWKQPGGRHTTYCLATPASTTLDLPAGSIIGHLGAIKEVPAKQADSLGARSQSA